MATNSHRHALTPKQRVLKKWPKAELHGPAKGIYYIGYFPMAGEMQPTLDQFIFERLGKGRTPQAAWKDAANV